MRILLAVTAVAASLMTGACSFEESICSSGNYATLSPEGGSACVKDGEEPPAGWFRYPAGKQPQHVDDKWDIYWRDHRIDKTGKEITAGTSPGSAPSGR